MSKQQPKKQMAVKESESNVMVLVQDKVPDYINQKNQRGSENVTTKDLVIPRLEIVQALSPAVKRGDPGYINGAQQGMLNNSVTRKLYKESVMVVPVHFSVQYLVWRDRKLAEQKKIGSEGGFFGAYPDLNEANARAEAEGGEDKAVIVVDTPTHLCLLIDPDTGQVDEIMISMPRTKAKISRQWNSMIRLAGGDRFGRVYSISAALQTGPKGDFYNYSVAQAGFPSKPLYEQAEKLYKTIAAGERKVVMDASHMETAATETDDM